MTTYFVVIGAMCLIGSLALMVLRLQVLIYGMQCEGEVVAYQVWESDDTHFYLPVISFYDHNGREWRFTSVAGSTRRYPKIGARMVIRYLASKPERAYIGTFLHMWAAPLGIAVLGVAGLVAYYHS